MQYLVSPLSQGGTAVGIHIVNQQPIWRESSPKTLPTRMKGKPPLSMLI